jgi:glycosyltransferase involved in cell wall biosynthesis
MNTIQVLIATMFKEDRSEVIKLLDCMNIDSDCIVVSQCNKNATEQIYYKKHIIKIIYSTERGLSKSRNMALQYADADIVVIADDDMRYIDGYAQKIVDIHRIYSDDVLIFQVIDLKKYPKKEKRMNFFLIHKIESREITMKLNSIKIIKFNEYFGTGSSYFQCGEENIFLRDCINKRKKIKYIPVKIALPVENRPSTWFVGYNKKRFIDQGAIYYELSHLLFIPFILRFAISKYNKYKKDMDMLHAIHYMLYGVILYIEMRRK